MGKTIDEKLDEFDTLANKGYFYDGEDEYEIDTDSAFMSSDWMADFTRKYSFKGLPDWTEILDLNPCRDSSVDVEIRHLEIGLIAVINFNLSYGKISYYMENSSMIIKGELSEENDDICAPPENELITILSTAQINRTNEK